MPIAADQQRVDEPDPERAPVGRKRRIADQRLIDVEAGGLVPEAEAHRDAARLHVGDGVAPGERDQRRERGREQPLIKKPRTRGSWAIDSRKKPALTRRRRECSASGSVQSPWVRKLVVL